MLRVHCTAEDLLRTTFAEYPTPLIELCLAISALHRPSAHPVIETWRRQTARNLPPPARRLLELIPSCGAGPEFLASPLPDLDSAVNAVRTTLPRPVSDDPWLTCPAQRPPILWIRGLAGQDRDSWRDMASALRAAYTGIIGNRWTRVQRGFRAEVAWRSGLLTRHGLRVTVTGLCPGLRWDGATLLVNCDAGIDLHPAGRGIVFQPSLFWTGPPLAGRYANGSVLVVYPAITPYPLLDAESDDDPLATLLGTTRAEALRTLVDHHTTTELARRLHVTPAAASMQASALRGAGLVTSRRSGKSVHHHSTLLGLDLLATAGTRRHWPT